MEYIKVSDNEIKVVDTVTEVKENVYAYKMLLMKKAHLEAERIRVIDNIDAELVKVNALLAECVKLGIAEKVVEPIEVIEKIK